ncbi:MAG: hypothetical protein WA268_08600, partial [Xanthobacteraceae bacterium]
MRELSNPNLHDIANMQGRVEPWTPDGEHVRWAVAATANVTIAMPLLMQPWKLAPRAFHAAQ